MTYRRVEPTFGAVPVTLCVALATFRLCCVGTSVKAVDIATITVAADDERLMAARAVVASCSVQFATGPALHILAEDIQTVGRVGVLSLQNSIV